MEVSGWAARTALIALIFGMLLGAAALGAAIGSQHRSGHTGAFCAARPAALQSARHQDPDSGVDSPAQGFEVVQLPHWKRGVQ